MKRINTFILALALLSSLWPTVTVAQSAPPTMPPNTVYGRLGGGTSGPGQAIPFLTLALQLAQSGIGSVYAVTPVSAPVGGLQLFAAPTATGAGNCLSAPNACTLATACLFVRQISTFIGAAGPVNLADGTYSTPDANGNLCTINGNGGGSSTQLTTIFGNAVTPTNVVLQVPVGGNGIVVQDGAEAAIDNLEFTAVNGSSAGLFCRQIAICDYGNLYWGAWGNSGSHVAATGTAVIVNPGSEHFVTSTTFLIHWNASAGATVAPGGTSTLGSSVSWSVDFASANDADLNISGWTLSGTGTGPQFAGTGNGFLNSGATACASAFPGSGGCVLSAGYQSSANDASTFSGLPIPLTTASNALSGNVTLNNTSNYFDGPSMAQGTTGTWWVSGTVSVQESTSAVFRCKLWDGTTIITSGEMEWNANIGENVSLTLSGFLASPAANIKISCRDVTSTGGLMVANVDGASNTASKISGMRIK